MLSLKLQVLETEMIGSVEVASVEFYEDGAKAEVKARADQASHFWTTLHTRLSYQYA